MKQNVGLNFFVRWTMPAVLVLLCGYFCVETVTVYYPQGTRAASAAAKSVLTRGDANIKVLVVCDKGEQGSEFADKVVELLGAAKINVLGKIVGEDFDFQRAVEDLIVADDMPDVIVVTAEAGRWELVANCSQIFSELYDTEVIRPSEYKRPDFLAVYNLVEIADGAAVLAIVAIGMTLVVIAGGIDLSVGGLAMLSAAVCGALSGRVDWAGPVVCVLCGIAACCFVAAATGVLVARFSAGPFIVTLLVMVLSRAGSFMLTGQRATVIPDWNLFGVSYAILFAAVLCVVGHILLHRTVIGRYIYAVGDSKEAARLSGVPVGRVIVFVYVLCGVLAGVGGIFAVSQGSGLAGESALVLGLYAIAAILIGGGSLCRGRGGVFGTVLAAVLLGAVRNGMELVEMGAYEQQAVLGFVVLGAVLFDRLKTRIDEQA